MVELNGEDVQTLEFVYKLEPTCEWTNLGDGKHRMDSSWQVQKHRIVKKTATRLYVEHDPYHGDGPTSSPDHKRRTFILDRHRLEARGETYREGDDHGTSYATAQAAVDYASSIGNTFSRSIEFDLRSGKVNSRAPSDHPCFAALGIEPSAKAEEVKAAFRRLSLERHPDVGGDQNGFIELRKAYEQAMRLAT
jgi:hypothetical protein